LKRKILSMAMLACLATPIAAYAADKAVVTTKKNAGPGSLRAALASGANIIVIKKNVGNIRVKSPLTYTGSEPLRITGRGQSVIGHDGTGPILHITNGADLEVSNLDFQGPGGFSIQNQGGGKGIFVEVPASREGTVSVKLSNLTVSGTGNHGVHLSDCELGDDCGAGQGEDEGKGSPASMFMQLHNVTIDGVGFGKQDADGVRIDDRGRGDIIFNATGSTFQDVGADGVEADEGGKGTVYTNVNNSKFLRNGAYCADTDDDGPFDPIALDPKCDDDGDPDVDDAFDIDEAGPGGIVGVVANVDIVDNFDEGLDFDTEGDSGPNGVRLDLVDIRASGNADEGIKVSEEGKASVRVRLISVDVEGDIEVEEENDGNLRVLLKGSEVGDDLKLSESDAGDGSVRIRNSTIGDEKDFNDITEL